PVGHARPAGLPGPAARPDPARAAGRTGRGGDRPPGRGRRLRAPAPAGAAPGPRLAAAPAALGAAGARAWPAALADPRPAHGPRAGRARPDDRDLARAGVLVVGGAARR